jgi:hypothetical protein
MNGEPRPLGCKEEPEPEDAFCRRFCTASDSRNSSSSSSSSSIVITSREGGTTTFGGRPTGPFGNLGFLTLFLPDIVSVRPAEVGPGAAKPGFRIELELG